MVEQKPSVDLRQHALERALVKVRWFGVAFAFFQIWMGNDPACPPGVAEMGCEPSYLRITGYLLAAGLGAANLLALYVLSRAQSNTALKRLGVAMFLLDHAFLVAFTWLYSFNQFTTLWVVLYILPLEGALRYSMAGTLWSFGIAAVTEVARDFYRQAVFGFEFSLVPDTTFRLGILLIIALVAGIMARNLVSEREEVERRAVALEELAERERGARSETQAFYLATLAGVSTGDVQEATAHLVETIGETLGYDSLAIAVLEERSEGRQLRVVAGYRYPQETIGRTLSLDQGVCGPVATSGEPTFVNDVRRHPTYLDFAPWARSEMAAPLRIGKRIIGVVNVESPKANAFTQDDLDQLIRLSAGVAVVVENAMMLAREKEAVKRLTELDRMKSDFIALSSHELRTPLTAIQGFVKTLRRPGFRTTEQQLDEYLEVIDRQSERLQDALDELLFVSQLEREVFSYRPESFDAVAATQALLTESFEDTASRIRLETPSEGITMFSDPDKFRRVVAGLVDNALKFSPPHTPVTVALAVEGSEVRIDVADQGIGIADEEQSRIFESFYQVGGPMKRSHQGFGLGLYAAKRIVENLGGSLHLESRPGEGATFTVRLPREQEKPLGSVAAAEG